MAGPTVIPSDTQIEGRLDTSGDLVVEGRCDGEIRAGGAVTVAAGAVCRASIRARTAIVHGEVLGPVLCSDAITVGRGARVVGDLRAPDIRIDAAAGVDGKVDLLPPDAEPVTLQRLAAATRGPAPRRPNPPEPRR